MRGHLNQCYESCTPSAGGCGGGGAHLISFAGPASPITGKRITFPAAR